MGETSNFYEKCSSLSKKGDEKSLRTLLQMGISGNKTARVALRKTRNKKLLKTLIDEYLDNIPSEYNAGMILNLAVKVLRKEYLYVYLMEIFHEKKDLKEIGFFKSVKDIPLDKQEQIEVKKYIIDTKDFDIRLISLIAVEEREDILYALLTKAMDDGLDARTTKIFLANKDYLQLIQPELREAIEKRVEGTSIFATYLDLKEKDNQKCIADFEKISLIYLAVKENVWDYGEMDFYHNSISIAFKLCRNEELTSSDWKEIKESTVHLAVLIISAVPLFMWLGRYAYIPFGILFIITMYWALKVEKLKKKNDIQTYKEIVAFTEGKKLDELHKAVEVGKRPYQNILKVIISAGVTAMICFLIGVLMHVFLN